MKAPLAFGHQVVRDRSMPMWCVGNCLLDPFGEPVLPPLPPLENLALICQAAKDGLIERTGLHDDDLVPWNPEDPEDDLRSGLVRETMATAKQMLDSAGVTVNTMTCNLHANKLFRRRALTNPEPKIRELARLKTERAARIGNFLGAKNMTYWIAREGYTSAATVPWKNVYGWISEGLNGIARYCSDMSMERGTVEPKPGEPEGYNFVQSAGHALAVIDGLENPSWWGVNPELRQHEGMTLLDSLTCLSLLVHRKKLFFLHFGNQIRGQMDNDFPPTYGPEGLEETAYMFWVLNMLEWNGTVEFDCHMIRGDGTPEDPIGCRKRFIEHCSMGLQMALDLAERLKQLPETRIFGGAEIDFQAKCLLTQQDPLALLDAAKRRTKS